MRVPRAAPEQGAGTHLPHGRLAPGTLRVASQAQGRSVPHRVAQHSGHSPRGPSPVPGAQQCCAGRRPAAVGHERAGGWAGPPGAWLPPPARSGSSFKGRGRRAASRSAVSENAAQSPLRGRRRGSHRVCHISRPTSTPRVTLNDARGTTPSCVFSCSGAPSLWTSIKFGGEGVTPQSKEKATRFKVGSCEAGAQQGPRQGTARGPTSTSQSGWRGQGSPNGCRKDLRLLGGHPARCPAFRRPRLRLGCRRPR